MMKPFMEGKTIAEVIAEKRLFISDLQILENMPKSSGFHMCSPIALFFENSSQQLLPVAIQLEQHRSSDNPVFLPSDNKYTWLMAKMWYNNADALFHQSCSHLAFTHIVMEGIAISVHRHLSHSHPIHRLLAPHFLFILAINTRALEKLVCPGGWVDKTLSCGYDGVFELMRRGMKTWRIDEEGTLPVFLEKRGVMTTPTKFPFRDDALLLYGAIHRYATKIVDHYYPTRDLMVTDSELQQWGQELARDKEDGGVGILGVPGDGYFTKNTELATLLTAIIYTCSVGHAATNFPQYDEYGFPPNYPGKMFGNPPTTKEAATEKDIMAMVPGKATTRLILIVSKILSTRGTQALGDFEVNFVFDPPAKRIVKEFKQDLAGIATIIEERNQTRDPPYTILYPPNVPNSISI